jgi:dihydroorotate dehydrogenase/Pyruvate/2-oxoacid:ferredoxin oxidoreductase delta subunit
VGELGGKKMSTDISTSIAGVPMRSPIGFSSATPVNWFYPKGPLEKTAQLYRRLLDEGAGCIKPVSVTNFPDDAPYASVGRWLRTIKGWDGYYQAAPSRVLLRQSDGLKLLELGRKVIDERDEPIALIGNALAGGPDPAAWVSIAKKLESAGADLIEINTGCPLFASDCGLLPPEDAKWGSVLGCEPIILGPIVKAIVQSVQVPIGVKLTPDVGFPGLLRVLNVVEAAGARYVTIFHGKVGIAPPDIYNGGKSRYPGANGINSTAFAGGAWNISSVHTGIALASLYFPNLEIFGGGGMTTPENVVEVMMLGARAVETLSGVLFSGKSFIGKTIQFLKQYMSEHSYKRIDDFRGAALQYIKGADEAWEIIEKLDYVAQTDSSLCTGCELCVDTICPAAFMENGQAQVRVDDCNGCALCLMVCPVDARTLVRRGTTK